MKTFRIERTELVTRIWDVKALDEDDAFDTLASDDLVGDSVKLISERSAHPQTSIQEIKDHECANETN